MCLQGLDNHTRKGINAWVSHCLPQDLRYNLRHALAAVQSRCGVTAFCLGTMFSGMDMVSLVLDTVCAGVELLKARRCKVKQLFACDNAPKPQQWIRPAFSQNNDRDQPLNLYYKLRPTVFPLCARYKDFFLQTRSLWKGLGLCYIMNY